MSDTTLPTIWEVPEELWEIFQLLLDKYDPPNTKGRKRIDAHLAKKN